MDTAKVEWPQKKREIRNAHTDSTIWNRLNFRPDDVVITTWGKCGTTWTQQIVSQLIFAGAEDRWLHEESPWLDMRVVPDEAKLARLEAQTHRRYVKTHCPVDGIVYSADAKYLFVARDPRDMIWSLHNTMYRATDIFYDMVNNAPGRQGPAVERPPEDVHKFFLEFLEDDTRPTILHPFWEYFRGWWAVRDLPNILFVHFNDLKVDMEGEIRRIAGFLDIEPSQEVWSKILEHCTFDYMKRHATRMSPPRSDIAFEGGAGTFINKGTNNRWKDVLTEEDNKGYQAKLVTELGEGCAAWLTYGKTKLT